MSAIAGFYGSAHPEQARTWLEAMIRTSRHRGPDTVGFYVDDLVGLSNAHSSLRENRGAAPPMVNRRGDAALSYDLDIFNHRELRDRLETRGHRFASRSQAEIVLRLYEQEGESFVEHLEGEFAIALWDARKRRLLLARDRVGARPLHYIEARGRLWFASEIKALFAALPDEAALSTEGLAQAFTYWAPLEPKTAFRNVHIVPAGSLWLLDESRSLLPKRYWDWSFPKAEELRRSEISLPEATNRLRALLTDAVRPRLDADKPVAAYLSGGLDSSGIVALMSQLCAKKVRTFSVSFDDPSLDEASHQELVARHFGSEHSTLRCSHRQIAEIFPKLIHHVEAPLLRTAPAPLLLLSAHVREAGYDVALTGEGADEVFAGYDLFKEAILRAFCARQPESRLRPRLFERLYPYLTHSPAKTPALAKAFFGQGLEHRHRAIFAHIPRWKTSGRALAFFSEPLRREIEAWDPLLACERMLPEGMAQWQPLARHQYVEIKTLLTSHLLCSQGDRVAMANAVATRMPYLDSRVIDYASQLPAHFKLQGLNEKYILRRALEGLLPSSIVKRSKQPYRAPDSACFFVGGKAADYVDALLDERRLREVGLFDPVAVAKLREKCRTGNAMGFADNQAFIGIVSTMLLDEIFVRNRRLS